MTTRRRWFSPKDVRLARRLAVYHGNCLWRFIIPKGHVLRRYFRRTLLERGQTVLYYVGKSCPNIIRGQDVEIIEQDPLEILTRYIMYS